MRKTILLFFSLFCYITLLAQETIFSWPIQSKKPGTDISYRPNDYIGGEYNNDVLVISADENSSIVSPITGRVMSFNYSYMLTFNNAIMFGRTPSSDYNNDCREIIKANSDKKYNPQYISITMGIKTSDGKIVYINGIRPEKIFKSGESVKAGDIIGKAGYFYYKINTPSIAITISKDGKAEDPMTPFGLKSTFRKIEKKKIVSLTQEEVLKDLSIFEMALEEVYPGLYDYYTPEKWENILLGAKSQIPEQMSIYNFWEFMYFSFVNQIKDNHLAILGSWPQNRTKSTNNNTAITFGFLNDSLVITNVKLPYRNYYGKRILEINGLTADSIRKLVMPLIGGGDGLVQSYTDYYLLVWTWNLFNVVTKNDSFEYTIKFSNDTIVSFSSFNEQRNSSSCVPYKVKWQNFFTQNTTQLTYEKIEKDIAYLGVHSFFLTETELDSVASFIKDLQNSSCKNLIIDLRNNPGGDEKICAKLFSFIAQEPFLMQEYSWVKKKNNFDLFHYTTNYTPEISDLFPDYEKLSQKEGYFLINRDTIFPNRQTNYSGNIYLITNERSISASTIFAGLLYKYHRGVIVGRETGSTYHQMNATKFANILLPNSQMEIAIPLVKVVFDSQKNRIPHGRGVLPDYPVNFSLEELSFSNGDTILRYALQLIHDEKYHISENHSEVSNNSSKTNYGLYIILFSVVIILSLIVLLFLKKRKNEKKR